MDGNSRTTEHKLLAHPLQVERFTKTVVKDHVMHFEERRLRYEPHIFDLEACLLAEYKIWCLEKRAQAERDDKVGFYALLARELNY